MSSGGKNVIRLFAPDESRSWVFPVLFEDEHYKARENIVAIKDSELGDSIRMQNVVGKLSRNPGEIRHAGPPLGAHNREILLETLGFTEDELSDAGYDLS